MAIKEELTGIVGAENVIDDPGKLKPYSRDYSLSEPGMPGYVVKPKNADEIQKIIQLANKNNLPVVPCSSGIHFNGDTIPAQGSIVLDLSGMNKILTIDPRNRMARVEAGVTWEQLQPELARHDMMAIAPLLPHHQKSALISHLERDPAVIPKFEYTDALVTVEVVLPEGEIFKTGSAAVPGFPEKSFAEGVNPSGPGNIMWTRLLQGAQGTLGVVTWGQFKIEYRPKVNKTYYVPFDSISDAVAVPPRYPNCSMSSVLAPFRPLAMAADRPAGPPPTMTTSYLPKTSISLAGSRYVGIGFPLAT